MENKEVIIVILVVGAVLLFSNVGYTGYQVNPPSSVIQSVQARGSGSLGYQKPLPSGDSGVQRRYITRDYEVERRTRTITPQEIEISPSSVCTCPFNYSPRLGADWQCEKEGQCVCESYASTSKSPTKWGYCIRIH